MTSFSNPQNEHCFYHQWLTWTAPYTPSNIALKLLTFNLPTTPQFRTRVWPNLTRRDSENIHGVKAIKRPESGSVLAAAQPKVETFIPCAVNLKS